MLSSLLKALPSIYCKVRKEVIPMLLAGALANGIAVFIGSFIGVIIKKGIPERINTAMMQGLALVVLYVGINGSLKGCDVVVMVISIVVGVLIGEWLKFDEKIMEFGTFIQSHIPHKESKDDTSVAKAFVNSTLFTCVGAMAIIGALQSGMTNVHETLYAKALIDGVVTLVMATTLGWGVALSGFSLIIYEGTLTLCAHFVAPYLSTVMINQMTFIGSLLIIALATNMLHLTNIKVANFILAPFLSIFLTMLMGL